MFAKPSTDVMILRIFLPKKFGENNWHFLYKIPLVLQTSYQNISFQENRQLSAKNRRKL
jgi:hypothetical protein